VKVAIVSESPTDEAVISVLIDALTGRKNQLVTGGRVRPGGWSGVIAAVKVELIRLHYHTDANVLVAVLDSDDSVIHDDSHELPNGAVDDCRVCKVRKQIQPAQAALRQRHVNYPVQVIVGLAVPALEAWLLYGTDPHNVEPKYQRDRLNPDAVKAARGLSNKLADLEIAFPKSFGRFAQQIRCC
jgi:hypothetical protein